MGHGERGSTKSAVRTSDSGGVGGCEHNVLLAPRLGKPDKKSGGTPLVLTKDCVWIWPAAVSHNLQIIPDLRLSTFD